MRFWIREICGTVLVLLGLAVFYLCLAFLSLTDRSGQPTPRILEAIVLMLIGIFIFRGGIQLLKVAF